MGYLANSWYNEVTSISYQDYNQGTPDELMNRLSRVTNEFINNRISINVSYSGWIPGSPGSPEAINDKLNINSNNVRFTWEKSNNGLYTMCMRINSEVNSKPKLKTNVISHSLPIAFPGFYIMITYPEVKGLGTSQGSAKSFWELLESKVISEMQSKYIRSFSATLVGSGTATSNSIEINN